MKFNLSDFLELDTTALLAVNGGSDCGGGYSPPSNSSPSDGGPSTPSGGGGSSSITGGGSGGGYCSGASDGKTVYANPYYKDGGKNSTSTSTGGGNCGNISGKNDLPAIPNTAEQKRRRILHMQTKGIFRRFMEMISEMKHVLQHRCSMKYRSNILPKQERR